MKIFKLLIPIFITIFLTNFALGQRELGNRPTETGGVVPYEQAGYDVKKYDISLKINPAEKSISGTTIVMANVVQPINAFVLDLDTPLNVSDVSMGETKLKFERKGGKIWSYLPTGFSYKPKVETRL